MVEMLKALGDQGKLLPIYEKAKEKAVELEKKKKEKDEKSQKPATWAKNVVLNVRLLFF